jgi:hypothetical protein
VLDGEIGIRTCDDAMLERRAREVANIVQYHRIGAYELVVREKDLEKVVRRKWDDGVVLRWGERLAFPKTPFSPQNHVNANNLPLRVCLTV